MPSKLASLRHYKEALENSQKLIELNDSEPEIFSIRDEAVIYAVTRTLIGIADELFNEINEDQHSVITGTNSSFSTEAGINIYFQNKAAEMDGIERQNLLMLQSLPYLKDQANLQKLLVLFQKLWAYANLTINLLPGQEETSIVLPLSIFVPFQNLMLKVHKQFDNKYITHSERQLLDMLNMSQRPDLIAAFNEMFKEMAKYQINKQ